GDLLPQELRAILGLVREAAASVSEARAESAAFGGAQVGDRALALPAQSGVSVRCRRAGLAPGVQYRAGIVAGIRGGAAGLVRAGMAAQDQREGARGGGRLLVHRHSRRDAR